jgi:N-acetyl-gamma-glutamyl-phosphate reductase
LSLKDAIDLYKQYYSNHPFVEVIDYALDVKMVVNTNRAFLTLQKEGDQLLVTGVIDNLLKGASGQAVQNMNLMFGYDQTAGLNLKPSAF